MLKLNVIIKKKQLTKKKVYKPESPTQIKPQLEQPKNVNLVDSLLKLFE